PTPKSSTLEHDFIKGAVAAKNFDCRAGGQQNNRRSARVAEPEHRRRRDDGAGGREGDVFGQARRAGRHHCEDKEQRRKTNEPRAEEFHEDGPWIVSSPSRSGTGGWR